MKVASYDEIFRAIKGEPVATLCSISFKPWFDTLQGVPAVFHLFDLPLPEELIRILRLVEPFLVSPEALQCPSGAAHRLACFAGESRELHQPSFATRRPTPRPYELLRAHGQSYQTAPTWKPLHVPSVSRHEARRYSALLASGSLRAARQGAQCA